MISVGEIGPGKGRASRSKRNYGEKAEKRGRRAPRSRTGHGPSKEI